MKKQFITFLAIISITLLAAQENAQYLKGAVPIENGRVTFSKTFNVAGSSEQLYKKALSWAEGRFNSEINRVVYAKKEEGTIVVTAIARFTFKDNLLSLDQADMHYQIFIECENNQCIMRVTNIYYNYYVSNKKEPEKYPAEKWITDEYSLTRKNTLNRFTKKFRIATIDFCNSLFEEVGSFLKKDVTTTPSAPQSDNTPPAHELPQEINALINDSKLTIMTGKEKTLLTDTEIEWKGFSEILGHKTAIIAIPQNSSTSKDITDIYTIIFSNRKATDQPSFLSIECKKQGEMKEGNNLLIIGEVLQVLF